MKFAYKGVNYPTGYDLPMTCEKLRDRHTGRYFVSVGSGVHHFAVCDDFGNLVFA